MKPVSTAAPEPGMRPESGGGMRAEVRRMHAGVLLFYIVDALLLGLLGASGSVPWSLGLWYAVAGCAATEIGFGAFWRRGGRAGELELLCLWMTASTAGVMLATLGLAPQVGGLMLMSMMAVLALGAVQLRWRSQLGLCVLLAAGSVVVLAGTGGSPGVPMSSAAERVLSAVWLAWLMVKGSAHNIVGTRLREQVKRAHAELAQALQKLEKVAATDELTLLPNRRAILARVEQAVAAGRPAGRAVGVALLDIDHFKRINDGHGHDVGDQVLREFGRVVALGLRPADQVGRYGGEEFLLVLQAFDDAGAAADVVGRLCAGIRAHDWARLAPGLAITASAGVALLMPGEDSAAAIRRADVALYRAKEGGRDRVVAAAAPFTAASDPGLPRQAEARA
jgi:diguanylate cyclase (GGDEF)-like protein